MTTIRFPKGDGAAAVIKLLPVILLSAFAILSFASMLNESVTVDEFAHLPAGYAYLTAGKFYIHSFNPPLVKMIAAAITMNMPKYKGHLFLVII